MPSPDQATPKTKAGWDWFWLFAARRQQIYWRRLKGQAPPWTDDPILQNFRFTNVYRASDRVSQFLINSVQAPGWDWPNTFVRTILFKLFNRPATWLELNEKVGPPSRQNLHGPAIEKALDGVAARGPVYNPAYIMPPPRQYDGPKHRRHLQLVRDMDRAGLAEQIATAGSLAEVFEQLRAWPSLGGFLAYQLAVDLNYSDHVDFDESQFVVAGPGARRGLKKCFESSPDWTDETLIAYTASRQELEFAARKLDWQPLPGRQLQLIDIQNIFCEVDKYTRLAEPKLEQTGQSRRPKQNYRFDPKPLTAGFPAKWGLAALKL